MSEQTYQPGDVANGHVLVEGEGWVPLAEHQRRQQAATPPPVPAPPTQPAASFPPPSPLPPSSKPAWYRRTWVIAVAAGVIGIGIGSAGSSGGEPAPDVTSSSDYKALQSQLNDTQDELETANGKVEDANAALGDLPSAQAQLEDDQSKLADDQAKLKKDQAALAADAKAVAKREKAVGIAEDVVAANTVGGDGMYKVGKEMKPGTYKTKGSPGCYYAVLNSTDTFDIAVNGNPDGPAFATVAAGQYFESTRCADWILQP